MTTKGLKHILRRVQTWAAQQEALHSLRAIEADLFDPGFGSQDDGSVAQAPDGEDPIGYLKEEPGL